MKLLFENDTKKFYLLPDKLTTE